MGNPDDSTGRPLIKKTPAAVALLSGPIWGTDEAENPCCLLCVVLNLPKASESTIIISLESARETRQPWTDESSDQQQLYLLECVASATYGRNTPMAVDVQMPPSRINSTERTSAHLKLGTAFTKTHPPSTMKVLTVILLRHSGKPFCTSFRITSKLYDLARTYRVEFTSSPPDLTPSSLNDIIAELSLVKENEGSADMVDGSSFHNDRLSQRLLLWAVRHGRSTLVDQILRQGPRDLEKRDEHGQTLLTLAIINERKSVVEVLLKAGANIDGPTSDDVTPLTLAIEKELEEIVGLLLSKGAKVDPRQEELGATSNYHIWRMLSDNNKTGKLAELHDLDSKTDCQFNAKVVVFDPASSGRTRKAIERPVGELLEDTEFLRKGARDGTQFKWIHLPANNMKWVEALVSQCYIEKASAYEILKPSRWVERQRNGKSSERTIRFMQPLCQGFDYTPSSTSLNAQLAYCERNIAMFMPYLHWKDVGTPENAGSKYQCLQRAYSNESDNLHSLHTRQTLDQFCYYTLKNTDERDRNQTVSRYQADNANQPKVVAMVDQLWLWVLVGSSGRADTIITCFPSTDTIQSTGSSGPDPHGFTDVFQNVMLYMLYESQAVKTPYDLAGVITSICSKVFLQPSRARKVLQFAEIYQSAINNIIEKETELFDLFSTMIGFRQSKADLAQGTYILDKLQELQNNESPGKRRLKELCETYGKDTDYRDVPGGNEIYQLAADEGIAKGPVSELLQKLGNFHILEISREVTLIGEIKDIQDELNIMAMIFSDQKRVVRSMEKIMHSIKRTNQSTESLGADNKLYTMPETLFEISSDGTEIDTVGEPKTGQLLSGHHLTTVREKPLRGAKVAPHMDLVPEIPPEQEYDVLAKSRPKRLAGSRSHEDTKRPRNEVWETGGDAEYSSLPGTTVKENEEEVNEMAERAARALEALKFLIDLKQKQSNVMDARSARVQADELLKLTKESEEQGQAIMMFTIATIIFLPLSFLSSFFALNISEFRRNRTGALGLGYVSEIMFGVPKSVRGPQIKLSSPRTSDKEESNYPLNTNMELTGNLTILASLALAGALDPSCAPGGNFDLSKWELQLPIGNGSPQIIPPAQLVGCSGYQDPGHHYFFTESGDGALVMKAPGTPSKTGCVKFAESEHCRTELGEKATWSPNTGTNRLFADLVGTNVHNICIGQVFQADSGFNKPFAELYYTSDGKIQFGTAKVAAGGGGQDLQLIGTVPVGTRFTYEVRFEGGQLLARINNNAFITLKTYFTTPKAFFKAGNYNQDLATTETADLHFFQLTITH
ncbi:hypothetical protein O1611_g433 [Lasiodiplodia mahajangana]|uniref:Uncharacterized protein n=1 Tax=Lasiodiplodia mahajangana TaxID=1108764 RepID=A0ACC2K173_9PEZI|nr:hypothetical protein O1611_g433 [Lasiodiplodia mahajangana]